MTSKQAYRRFLKSAFWLELSARKRASVGHCERCRTVKNLQCHHWRYPGNWADTTLDDLKVLCRRCHRREHGIISVPFLIHRNDWVFSAFLHRCHCLIQKLTSGRGLRPRDERFLELAERTFPPTEADTCMAFHVGQVRDWWTGFKEGKYT